VRRRVTHSLVQALQVVPAFASLDDRTLVKIVGASANLAWPAGGSVFEKGTPGDALYIVLSGSVSIVDVAEDGESEITRVNPGDFFGEVSLMMDTSHSMTARAAEDSELMVLPKESLQELLEANPELHDHFRRKVEERLPESLSKLS
jgi:CRP/FNR family cyclic AMP-dependent transcriptional regulator